MAELKQYIEEVNENRNSKEILLEDLIDLNRFDESCGEGVDVVTNDNEELIEFYEFLQDLIVKYGLDFELNNEEYIIDRIYGNGINAEKVAYYYFEEFLKQRLLSL